MSAVQWRWARAVLGGAVLAFLLWRLGTGPFVAGLRRVDPVVVGAGLLVGAGTTLCAAWRWRVVSDALGVPLSPARAVAASYRAQFLNSVLPGGVLGDLHRGVRHGVDSGAVGRGLRSVLWDRAAGQAVQVVLTLLVLALLPSPVDPAVLAGVVLVALVVLALAGAARRSRVTTVALADLRAVGRSWPAVVVASCLAVGGYVVMLVVAARAVGVTVSLLHLVPLALLLLLAMSIPFNVGGWGPREGVAAWAFASAGLGASTGVGVAVVYGVMSLVAALPGAVVLLGTWLRRSPRSHTGHTDVHLEGAQHG